LLGWGPLKLLSVNDEDAEGFSQTFLGARRSLGQKEFVTMAAGASGGLAIAHQIGYGLAAFGVGPLRSVCGVGLATIYGAGSLLSATMLAMTCVFVQRKSVGAEAKG
jgi:hypothetical protein